MMDIATLVKHTMVGNVPHMGEPNLKLFCSIPTGNYTTDSVGNRKPVYSEVILIASVREDDYKPGRQNLSGATIEKLDVIGRLVSPLLLPVGVDHKKRYKAELTDNATGLIKKGEFEFLPIVQNRVSNYSQIRGSSIKGSFVEIK
jgi:hypothetical protein